MANELKFTYDGAGTVTGAVVSATGTIRGTGITMTEATTSNLFLGDAPGGTITGDIFLYYIDGVLNDSEVYDVSAQTLADILEGDSLINTTNSSQFTLDILHKTTKVVLVQKNLQDDDGNPITDLASQIVRRVEP